MSGHFILENPRSSLMFDYMMTLFSAIKSIGRKVSWENQQWYVCFHILFYKPPKPFPKKTYSRFPLGHTMRNQVFRVDFWMQLFKSETPKPTTLISSSPSIKSLLASGAVKRISSEKVTTCRKYVDSQGKSRYHGTKQLKQTQTLT